MSKHGHDINAEEQAKMEQEIATASLNQMMHRSTKKSYDAGESEGTPSTAHG